MAITLHTASMGEIMKSSLGLLAVVTACASVSLILGAESLARAATARDERRRREEAEAAAERLARRDRDTRIAGVQRRREQAAAEYRGWVKHECVSMDAGRDTASVSSRRREAGETLLRIDAELSALLASR